MSRAQVFLSPTCYFLQFRDTPPDAILVPDWCHLAVITRLFTRCIQREYDSKGCGLLKTRCFAKPVL